MSNSYLTNDALQRAIKAVLPLISLYLPPGVGIAAWATKIIIDVLKKNPDIVSDVLLDGGLYFLVPALIGGVGFTSSGVLKGSFAAFIQSTLIGGQTGGIFSVLQRIGATAIVSPPMGLALGSIALLSVGYLWWTGRGLGGEDDDNTMVLEAK